MFHSTDFLWEHAHLYHHDQLPKDPRDLDYFRAHFEARSRKERNPSELDPPPKDIDKKRILSFTLSRSPLQRSNLVPNSQRASQLNSDLKPPVTKASLSELDIDKIVHNPRLRHDINFDPDLHFRPNLDGEKERRKTQKSTLFYDAMRLELVEHLTKRETFESRQDSLTHKRLSQAPRKRLWTPEDQPPLPPGSRLDPPNIASVQAQRSRARASFQTISSSKRTTTANTSLPLSPSAAPKSNLIPQPETRPISQEQLVAEVKSIYAGLVMVEAKCIEVDKKQATQAQANETQSTLNNEQWQALIALHRTLLHEHHDFFLASQHPSASPALRRLASKYAMPARMWRHGIHSFLELLRHRLPASLDHMLAFIYLAYSMMALLYETVPAFKDTWIECLGDLGRYRMAIEDDDIGDGEAWSGVARLLRNRLPASPEHMLAFIYLAYSMMALVYEPVPAFENTWIECLGDLGRYRMAIEDDDIRDRELWSGLTRHCYSTASDKVPTTGRLYHYLAILARPNALQQLFYYAKSLGVEIPFISARESILTLFKPVFETNSAHGNMTPFDTAFVKANWHFVKAHGQLFASRNVETSKPPVDVFMNSMDNHIDWFTWKLIEQEDYIDFANSVAMLGFTPKDSIPMNMKTITSDEPSSESIWMADNSIQGSFMSYFWRHLNIGTPEIALQRGGDPNVLPFIHVTLIFMLYASQHPEAMRFLERKSPWEQLSIMLNTLLASRQRPDRNDSHTFPLPHEDDCPLPEDYILRGLLWADKYFPGTWFTNEKIEEEERDDEVVSTSADRKERILWLGHRIISGASWTGKAILAALQNKSLRSIVLLSQLLKSFPVTLASAIVVVNTTGTETPPQVESNGNGPSQYFGHLWLQLRDKHSGPIIENTTVAAVLSSSYFIITYLDDGPKSSTPILPLSHPSASKSWVQADLLPIATAFISASTLYLGNGKLESDWQLAMLATHNLCLSIRFLRQKLSKFPKTQKPVEFIMASTSLSLTGLLTKFFPVNEGRYKNPLIQAGLFLPLTNLFITVFWIRFIRNYGIATALEQGQGHLIAATRSFWQERSYSIIAVALILLLLAKV
ncbi:TPR-like protein [Glarea lozoyensis ATCC 20868]|uniref:Nonsense-mediated mRNA decay factor n=1 Tax=Glarea lozoyensis (strain ATCC 20868 / MF5171) TaxID=1116229 RepID=S3DFA2_GLAL2|nr:TPR-like protein [Glarea lozoyensis ATCC 20868]EPE25308.1 TPR-like protein [Glarea lozoyensis ATCC 20868]